MVLPEYNSKFYSYSQLVIHALSVFIVACFILKYLYTGGDSIDFGLLQVFGFALLGWYLIIPKIRYVLYHSDRAKSFIKAISLQQKISTYILPVLFIYALACIVYSVIK
jgi:hypothetical protein